MTTATLTDWNIQIELQYGGGWLAWCDEVPGLESVGDTPDEAERRLRRALAERGTK